MKRSSKSAKKSTSKRTTPSTDQKTLEELEQGFSPYINGANVDLPVFQKQNSNNSNRKRSTPSFSKHHDNGNTQSTGMWVVWHFDLHSRMFQCVVDGEFVV
eukprot:TRINITY_DN4276_c0_g3_i5.p1 TRINITY_DN4276_c0_g3~~TRINITY_DN4276_c0_g3_i5.p1  ORF type:complete len:101 (-),score=25.02 TRINITY_DN4276_c0_g3_i5:46-348(-)